GYVASSGRHGPPPTGVTLTLSNEYAYRLQAGTPPSQLSAGATAGPAPWLPGGETAGAAPRPPTSAPPPPRRPPRAPAPDRCFRPGRAPSTTVIASGAAVGVATS